MTLTLTLAGTTLPRIPGWVPPECQNVEGDMKQRVGPYSVSTPTRLQTSFPTPILQTAMSSSDGKFNYAHAYGIESVAAAVTFAALYATLLPLYLVKQSRHQTKMFFLLFLCCASKLQNAFTGMPTN